MKATALHTFVWISLLVAAAPAFGQSAPLDQTKQLVVMIEGELDGAPSAGAGIIFGRAADRFYIATANHVVRRGGREAQSVRVLLTGLTDRWLDARLTPHADPSPPGLDLAVLTVSGLQHGTVDVCGLAVDRLGRPDSVQRGLAVYPLGYPQGRVRWGMPVTPQHVAQFSRHEILFESAAIVTGYSGGVLMSEDGNVLGLIQSHDAPFAAAIRIDTILAVLRKWNYPVELRLPSTPPPLYAAVTAGDAAAVERLVRAPCAQIDERYEGVTALQEAAEVGSAAIVRTLLRAGAKTNLAIDNPKYVNWTPLQIAADTGHTEVVKVLLGAGAAVDGTGASRRWLTPLRLAAWSGHSATARVLRSAGAKLDFVNEHEPSEDDVMLHRAAKSGNLSAVKVLLELGAKANERNGSGETPLFHAIGKIQVDIVTALLAAGADPNAKTRGGQRPLAALIVETWRDDEEVRRERPSREPDLLRIASALITAGARLDDVGSDGDNDRTTALERASGRNQVDVVRWLLKKGAKVNERDGLGRTALFSAVEARGDAAAQRELIAVLLAAGIDVNAIDKRGDPALCRALWDDPANPRIVVAEILLKAGAKAQFMEQCKWQSGRSWAPNEKLNELLRSYGAK